ncbi:MAG: LCP family protein [Christensenellaceae bacterium]|nr:LCP family protein [Christensenellaceae bacterium]
MFKRTIAIILIFIVAFTSMAFAKNQTPSPITPYALDAVPLNNEGQHHYLLLCTDQWDFNPNRLGNTDGILLLTLDTRVKRVMLTSFSRDILVQRPDGVIGRITFIAKNYGPDALCEIMSTHFGVKIEKYILFDMKHVENIIDHIGGVNIEVNNAEARYLKRYAIPRDSTVPQMDLEGKYLFDGHAAVIFMRIRKVGNGDYGRTQRVRTVLSTIADKCKVMDKNQAEDLLGAIIDNIGLTNMSLADMFTALGYALDLRGAEVKQLSIPSADAHKIIMYAGMIVMDLDYEKARKSIADFLGDSFLVVD